MSLNSDLRDINNWPEGIFARPAKSGDDHFVVRNGVRCAGVHLLIELYGANPVRLRDEGHIERVFRACADAAGATVVGTIDPHVFEDGGGVTAVAKLAESHISIHTWPEHGYAAVDVFMCGQTDIDACPPIIKAAFDPMRMTVEEKLRGTEVA